MAVCPVIFLPEVIELCVISQSLWNCCFYNSLSVSNEVIQFPPCIFAISGIKFKQHNQETQRKMAEAIMRPVYYSKGDSVGVLSPMKVKYLSGDV